MAKWSSHWAHNPKVLGSNPSPVHSNLLIVKTFKLIKVVHLTLRGSVDEVWNNVKRFDSIAPPDC